MIRLFLSGLCLCGLLWLPSVAQPAGSARNCLSTADTVEAVRQHNLSSPALALRTASAHARAEALRLVLCNWKGGFIYEITLLKRYGKVTRRHGNAADGVLISDQGLH